MVLVAGRSDEVTNVEPRSKYGPLQLALLYGPRVVQVHHKACGAPSSKSIKALHAVRAKGDILHLGAILETGAWA